MGIYLRDNDHDCLTNMRFADDVLLFASSKEQLRKMLCEFKRIIEKVGLRIHPQKTKILSNQSSDTRKEIEINDRKVEILTRGESTKLWPDDNFPATGDDRNQKSNQGRLGNVPQVQTGADILLKHQLRLFDAVVTPTMSYVSGTWSPTKEHERMIQSTQRKMLRLIFQTKRRYKNIVKRKDADDLGSTGDESEDGQGSKTHNGQDSDVSFENDTDEDIDTTVIEEEDWIEYIKKKHRRSHGKYGKCEDSMPEEDPQKNEMEIGAEKRNNTEWEMVSETCRMEP